MVPNSLRVWFVVHFVVDVMFAVPLIVAPTWTLQMFGWSYVDPMASRLAAAALLGIGVESWIGRNEGVEVFRAMLNLKVIWSSCAVLGGTLAMTEQTPVMGWAVVAIFAFFCGVWTYYRLVLGRGKGLLLR